jgi:hypothetical protein
VGKKFVNGERTKIKELVLNCEGEISRDRQTEKNGNGIGIPKKNGTGDGSGSWEVAALKGATAKFFENWLFSFIFFIFFGS